MLSGNSNIKAVLLWALGMFASQAVFAYEMDALIVPIDSPTALKTLEDRLPDLGWRVQRAPDGALLLYPGSGLSESTTVLIPRRDVSKMRFFGREIGELRRQLLTAGWGSVDMLDGDLILTPGVKTTPTPAGERPSIVETDHGGFDELRLLLASHGWRAERSEIGGLLLYPGRVSISSSSYDTASMQSGDPTGADIPSMEESGPLFFGMRVEKLRPILLDGGWGGVERTGDDLILYLAGQSSGSDSDVSLASEAVAKRNRNPEPNDASHGYKAVKALLTYHGWRVERGTDRGVILYPSDVRTDLVNQDTAETTSDGLFGMGIQDLRRHLVSSGWRRVEQHNGDILIFTG